MTFWGTIGLIQKTFKLTHKQAMWGDSWINLKMKMADMPYANYRSEGKAKEGTIEDLKNHFGKYIQK